MALKFGKLYKRVHGSIKPPVWSPVRRQICLNPVWHGEPLSPASLVLSRRPFGLVTRALTAHPPNWIQTNLATPRRTKPPGLIESWSVMGDHHHRHHHHHSSLWYFFMTYWTIIEKQVKFMWNDPCRFHVEWPKFQFSARSFWGVDKALSRYLN